MSALDEWRYGNRTSTERRADRRNRLLAAGLEAFGTTGFASAGVRAHFDVMTADPRWSRIALVETVGVSPAVDAARRAAIARFAEFLEVQAGVLADLGLAERRDFRLAARAIVGALTELVSTWPERSDRR